jgi:hypothetical protein
VALKEMTAAIVIPGGGEPGTHEYRPLEYGSGFDPSGRHGMTPFLRKAARKGEIE